MSGAKAFDEIATTESDCSSAKRGGDLGTFGRGKMQGASCIPTRPIQPVPVRCIHVSLILLLYPRHLLRAPARHQPPLRTPRKSFFLVGPQQAS